MRRTVGTILITGGLAVGLDARFGPAPVWLAVVLSVVGLIVLLLPARSTDGSSADSPVREGPAISGLGTNVERILKLAEVQAADHRAEAQREAERIIEAARQEADAITSRARMEAGEAAHPIEERRDTDTG